MKQDTQKLILGVRDLPSIPSVIADTVRVLDDVSASSMEIEWVVARDQTLTARVLRVVNSAAYAFSRKIESTHDAVIMLGTRKLKHMAIVMVTSKLFDGDATDLFDPRQLWLHALATSLWAKQIIEWKQLWGYGSAVTAALLHDLGILILMQKAHQDYRPVLDEFRQGKLPLIEIEQRELGTTHAIIGGALCAKWQLPVSVTLLVSHHHSMTSPVEPALSVVMLANRLAHLTGIGPFACEGQPELSGNLLGITTDSGSGLDFFKNSKQSILDQVAAFRDAVNS